jgi:hypothetical protein
MPNFDWLAFHPRFEDHQAESGRRVVTCDEAEEAWWGEREIVPNRKGARAPYLMLGTTREPRDITVVLFGTDLDDTWLAYTGWTRKESDR